MRVDVARRSVALSFDALFETRGCRREKEGQHLRRRTRDRAALGFERASATGSHTVLREQTIGIRIVDGRYRAVLSNAHRRVHPLRSERAQVICADQRTGLLLPTNAGRRHKFGEASTGPRN